MPALKLIIGSKNYSSWSLRPWLALRQFDIPFTEELIRLDTPDAGENIKKLSPSGKVPLLIDGSLKIWETLAIMEYLAELFPEKHLWPQDKAARAMARSISNEMHAGFADLRNACPMNMRRHHQPKNLTEGTRANIARIDKVWQEARANFAQSGDFLFGQFSIADAMFAPVVSRIVSYALPVSEQSQAYVKAVTALPAYQDWWHAAQTEAGTLARIDEI